MNITPSTWWFSQGGTVSVNWFLLTEQPNFSKVFDSVLKTLVPGAVIFITVLFAKRKGWEPFASWERKLRGAPPPPPPLEQTTDALPLATPAEQLESQPPETATA
jgi:hypothetical protein